MPIRVVLADDHQIVLHGLQGLFAQQEDFEVVRACRDAASAIAAVADERPDVVVLDLRAAGGSGLDVLRALADRRIAARAVLLTAAIRDEEVVLAVKLGAMGLVLKESSPDALLDCVRAVHRGEQWIERETTARAISTAAKSDTVAHRPGEPLTPREIEIVKMVALGLQNKVIAERLAIAEGTVKVHLHNIDEKFGVEGRLELLLCAQQKGLI